MPQVTKTPSFLNKIAIIASRKNDEIIPSAELKKPSRTDLRSSPTALVISSNFIIRTGRTHGIKFSITPPKKAIIRIINGKLSRFSDWVDRSRDIVPKRIISFNSAKRSLSTKVKVRGISAEKRSSKVSMGTFNSPLCRSLYKVTVGLPKRMLLIDSIKTSGSVNVSSE